MTLCTCQGPLSPSPGFGLGSGAARHSTWRFEEEERSCDPAVPDLAGVSLSEQIPSTAEAI
jgi:hypothetical protein